MTNQDHEVSVTVEATAPIARVWRAITEPAELLEWYAPGCRWEIVDLRVGSTVRFFNTETDVQVATIAECTPPRMLSLRWVPDPTLPESRLLNTYELRELSGTTLVSITQTGYDSVPELQRATWIAADEQAIPAIANALVEYLKVSS